MGLRYDQDKLDSSKENTTWASYSDLFMVLSFVFLLLYVVTTLKDTTTKVVNGVHYKELQKENKQLKREVLAYNNLKEKYLNQEASRSEKKEYERLMSHLNMLKQSTDSDNLKLKEKIAKNKKRKKALNEYQRMIKNIINANILAKKKIVTSKKVIRSQDKAIGDTQAILSKKRAVIALKKEHISSLNNDINKQIKKIEEINLEKNNLNRDLKLQVFKAKRLQAQGKITKENMLAKIELIKDSNAKELSKIENKFTKAQDKLKKTNKELSQENIKLAEIKSNQEKTIDKQDEALNTQSKQISNLEQSISQQRQILENSKKDFTRQKSQIVASYNQKISQSESDYQKQLKKEKSEKEKYKGNLEELKKVAKAKKALMRKLASDLKAAGINAGINEASQEVEISFGKQYFDTGKYNLKKGMKKIVKKFMPTYAKTLFSNPKLMKKVKSVEIIGFSSPTYKGKVINPSSLNEKNRKAINYNLDLSYYRARSIFQYAFNKKNVEFENQNRLLPYIKVTGRSFLQENIKKRSLASGISVKQYCKRNNCKKSQKVIIKFNMD